MMSCNKFKTLQAADYGIFCSFLRDYALESCERSWANLLLYQDTYFWKYAIIENRLWIVSFEQAYAYFPLGDFMEPALLANCWQSFTAQVGKDAVMGDVPEEYLLAYPHAEKFFKSELDYGEADYIYNLMLLHSFSGSKLRKRHNQLRQFDREYEKSFSVKSVTWDMLDQIIAFAAEISSEYWSFESGQEEKLAFGRLKELWQYEVCKLSGVSLWVNDELAGFSIYSPLSDTLADIHFEKADHSYCGCGAKLTWLLTEKLLEKGFLYMNREQDLNIEGLRRAKRALDPDHLFKRYNFTKLE